MVKLSKSRCSCINEGRLYDDDDKRTTGDRRLLCGARSERPLPSGLHIAKGWPKLGVQSRS
jgi:hypothetical protein